MIPVTHLHPMLVHFPIALITFGFLAELAFLFFRKEISLTKTGYYLLMAGLLTGGLSWLTGNFFTPDMSGKLGEIKEIHALFATITVVLVLLTSIMRTYILVQKNENSNLKGVAFILYALATISVGITGFLGGELVYTYMLRL